MNALNYINVSHKAISVVQDQLVFEWGNNNKKKTFTFFQ